VAVLARPTTRGRGAQEQKARIMYNGEGTVVLILAVIIVVMLMRGRRV
jgi:hypothetical protein